MESTFLHPAKVIRAAHLDEGVHVADFGAGSGFFTRAAAREIGPSGRVWAVDIQRDMLSHIKNLALVEGLQNVEVVHGDVARLCGSKLPDKQVDFVIAANILFTLEDKEPLVAEIHRVLQFGGRALIIDWKDSFGGLGPHPSHVCTEAFAHELFSKHGFSYLATIPAGEYHWGFVVRKKV